MSKAQTLASTVSTGGVLADGTVAYAEVTGTPSVNDLLPSQTGNTGKYLSTNGSTSSWATVSGTPDFVLHAFNIT